MPRAKPKSKETTPVTSYAGKELPVDPATLMPKIELRTMKPGAPDYDPDKDSMIVGFKPGTTFVPNHLKDRVKKVEDLTPYHFLTDSKTGLRPGESKPPEKSMSVFLTRSIVSSDRLPPLAIWRAGEYLSDLLDSKEFDLEDLATHVRDKAYDALVEEGLNGKVSRKIYNLYITSGEGSNGNYKFLVYELPRDVASNVEPRHPLMWADKDFDVSSWGGPSGGGYSGSGVSVKPAAPKAPPLPAGVRMRCSGCGHWFKTDDLAGHVQVCASTNGGDADWAMMCCAECGCRNLHEASTPKPGFPKPKAEKEAEPKEAETAAVTT